MTEQGRIEIAGIDEDDLGERIDNVVRLLAEHACSIVGIEWLRGSAAEAHRAAIVYRQPLDAGDLASAAA